MNWDLEREDDASSVVSDAGSVAGSHESIEDSV